LRERVLTDHRGDDRGSVATGARGWRGGYTTADASFPTVLQAPLVSCLDPTTSPRAYLVDLAADGLTESATERRTTPAIVEAKVQPARLVTRDVTCHDVLSLQECGVLVDFHPCPDVLLPIFVRKDAARTTAHAIEVLARGARTRGSARRHGSCSSPEERRPGTNGHASVLVVIGIVFVLVRPVPDGVRDRWCGARPHCGVVFAGSPITAGLGRCGGAFALLAEVIGTRGVAFGMRMEG
jgi:hypothetical protein